MPEPGPDEPVLPATVSSDKAASPQGEVAAMPGEAGGVALPTALTPDASEGSPREGCERYELLELLGSGGMGEVHKARVAVNCAAIPQGIAERLLFGSRRGAYSGAEDAEGYLQAAHGGTLFLDEVVELELAVQAKRPWRSWLRLHFATNPKTGTNTATWDYSTTSSYHCTSTLTYVSDFGGAVVVFKAGSTDPVQVWWYEDDAPAYSDTNTFGYLSRLTRGL